VNFGQRLGPYGIVAVVTQGRDNVDNYNQYVKSYKVFYSVDYHCNHFVAVIDSKGNEKVIIRKP